ncbi:MAG: hypothetical protein DRI79_02060 [Chloroflexi bacterium]|nr:MAG: hypothetical protein DRI80_02325 [Chloroflexota bacterium]RLC91789.1 MAG: hypothetical protein DRI79_02060 [Chloroflexota bacterium]HEY67043.1 hypothetical protein [Thermoflexia bacterium]
MILDVEIVGLILGAGLTLLIFSYLLGDNPLYRLALHLFIGALVGYSFGIVLRDVLIGMLLTRWLTEPVAVVVPLVLGLLLLFKGFPRHAYVGNFSIAYLVGVGTAVALSGALLGTLVPQVGATGRALSLESFVSFRLGPLDGLLILVGTVCTLMAFNFTARKRRGLAGVWARLVGVTAWVGRVFLIFAFGVAFAGALTAALSIFVGRIQYLIDVYFRVAGFLGG